MERFTQWRIDLLGELLLLVTNGFGEDPGVAVSDVKIWYDEPNDFHRLSFVSQGTKVDVRFYKVFSVRYDDVRDGWVGCLRSSVIRFAKHIRENVRRDTDG
jgi:hypothetical protein